MIYDAFGFSNYPKMWFYLQLKIVFTLSFFGLVKSISCFCVVFKVHLLVIFPHYFVASSSPSVNVPFYVRFGQARHRASYCEKITSHTIEFTLFSVPSKLDNATGQLIRPG